MSEKLYEMGVTKDELDRIGEALKKKEFRDLLADYCAEISDPANKKQYEDEITELEKERGINVTFIHPNAGFVIKTSIDGNKLAFINICSNDHAGKPSAENSCQDGSRGRQWSLPHLISPPRDDMSKKGSRCQVYDVIFHPDTLNLASKNKQFRDMVTKVACEAVESNFSVHLDQTNLKFPKIQYKGVSRPLVIRSQIDEPVSRKEDTSEVEQVYTDMYKQLDQHYGESKGKQNKNYTRQKPSEYSTPKYSIKHRNHVDMQEYSNDADAKLNIAIPTEIIVEINLPLLKSANDLVLDVSEKSLKLISEKPSKYKLDLTLPYSVIEDNGKAKFDVDTRKLVVTLPVKRNNSMLLSDIGRYDSGVDSDNSPPADSPIDNPLPLIEELSSGVEHSSSVQSESEVFRTSFLNPDFHYSLPEYTCHLFDNVLSFTLNVKNVDTDSIKKEYNESYTSLHMKFASISSGYFPVNYAFFVQLPNHFIDSEHVSSEIWDNNVIVQIPYKPCDKIITTYFIGTSQEDSQERILEEPSIINRKFIEEMDEAQEGSNPKIQVDLDSDDELTITINSDEKQLKTRSISESSVDDEGTKSESDLVENTKNRSFSESSIDEPSTSLSPNKKSILKAHSRLSRSISESSVDDYTWSSIENCAANSEPLIPEESENLSSSMKKTVRFNDVVSKQLFRSNSSILGQRKKNQRKNRNKKRAQERRMSESEASEGEDKKMNAEKNGAGYFKKDKKDDQVDFKSDLIFDLDM